MEASPASYSNLLLANTVQNPKGIFERVTNEIVSGEFNRVLQGDVLQRALNNDRISQLIGSSSFGNVDEFLEAFMTTLQTTLAEICGEDQESVAGYLHIIAVTFLQIFVQLNFTGPYADFQVGAVKGLEQYNKEFVKLLSSMGQMAYHLAESPYLLVIAIKILETLNQSSVSFLNSEVRLDDTEQLVVNSNINTKLNESDVFLASVQWWRSRAYQVQTSLLPEPSSILTSVSSMLLNPSVLSSLVHGTSETLGKQLALVFYLETARNGLNTNTEQVSVSALAKAKKVSGLDLILTGCRAKRTKYQEKAHAALVILAHNPTASTDLMEHQDAPASFELNSDLLLERPVYERVGEEPVDDFLEGNDTKRIKLDFSESVIGEDEDQDSKLLPIALGEQGIPENLKALDPNDQPRLSDLDMAQLLLRFTAVKQTSPYNSPLVEEELTALVQRILYSPDGSVNWSIFSKSLWERSLLETNKAKTIERGVLQMQSIVEELGASSLKTRLFAQTEEQVANETDQGELPSARRLKLVHQLPLKAKWSMDAELAEKFMSLGVLRSALEIYERLQMWNEAALCHAAVGEEKVALEILEKNIEENPNDARTLSILGDVKQDPKYWEKSWEVGRYPKAKDSLAKYFYSPPKSSGLSRDLGKAIDAQYDSLTINPLSFESWYFYGCLGLEATNYELAAEAFTRCVSISDDNAHAWSNLSSALVSLDKLKPALNALQNAVKVGKDLKSWRIWENYLIVAAKLRQWDDVLLASKQLLQITKESSGENAIDIPVVEKLVDVLVSEPYNETKMTYFQRSCVEYVCVMLPGVINTSARCWRIISKVELWRQRPWAALDVLEKAYRSLLNNPELEYAQAVWDEAVESCSDLVAAYENYGELPGRHGGGDLVCKDWKYKAKTSVRSLLSRGKNTWSDLDSYTKLQDLKEELQN